MSAAPGPPAGPAGDASFDAPWQVRAFALSRALVDSGVLRPADVRDRLAAELAAHPDRPYWDSFVAALEKAAPPVAGGG